MKNQMLNGLLTGWGFGRPECDFFAVIDGEKVYGEFCSSMNGCDVFSLVLEKKGLFQEHLTFRSSGSSLVCRREFRNLSEGALKLNELGMTMNGLKFSGRQKDDFFYHNENPRIYEVMAFPIDYKRTAKDAKDSEFDIQAGNRWADPGVICERIGRSPYQPFPAIVLGNFKSKRGLVHGTLSQRCFYHNYLVHHEEGGSVCLKIFSSFKDVAYLNVPSGKIYVDEWYLGVTEQADEVEHVFDGYTAELRKVLPPMYGATDINRTTMVWGSWNDGIFRDISEKMLLEEAAYLKKNFPTVRWLQVDDGYAVNVPPAHGLGMPYEGEEGVDHKKFPEGLRAFTDKVRKIGLRPAIWIGGFCPDHTKIMKEHPEWFIDYSYRVKKSSPLDVSQQVVRDYMTFALDKLVVEYGFEAVKHDFWSYAFEDSNDLYKNHDHSGYEYRDWWTKEMRRRIARDGYFQTGCDIVMGNPFLGEQFTNYRYGIDIGGGDWDFVKTNYLWGMACFATHTGDLFVPNSDSVGLFPGLKDTEADFCLNYCLVTHSMVEIAGRLSQHPASPRLAKLKKAVCNPNNGQEIFFGKWNYLDAGDRYPRVIYFKTGHFCPAENQPGLPLRTAGLFNLEDKAQTVRLNAAELKLSSRKTYLVTDVWNGESYQLQGSLYFDLPAHGSRLLAVSEEAPRQLLDADIRIMKSSLRGRTMKLYFDYAAPATLVFNAEPAEAVWNQGTEGKVTISGRKLILEVPENGELTVRF